MARIFKTPFGAQGDTEQVPEAPQGDGSVSLTQGFGYDYEREYEDPAAKDIRREVMNGLFHDITEAIGDIQLSGVAKWSADAAPYPAGAVVWHSSAAWMSTAGNNSSEPGEGETWADNRPLGVGQTWQNVLVSRAWDTTYTNTTGRAIMVSVCARGTDTPGDSAFIALDVDGVPVFTSRSKPSSGASYVSVSGVVPAGSTYIIRKGSQNEDPSAYLISWAELR